MTTKINKKHVVANNNYSCRKNASTEFLVFANNARCKIYAVFAYYIHCCNLAKIDSC